jgi:hypothetical protein
MTHITIELPDDLARQAQDAGLLMPEQIAVLLRSALQHQKVVEELHNITAQLMSLNDALTSTPPDAQAITAWAMSLSQKAG